MQSPEFLQQMSSLMSNPAILDQIIALNPQLASMGPQIREVFQSEQFRQMVFVTFSLAFPTPLSMARPLLTYPFLHQTGRIQRRCVP